MQGATVGWLAERNAWKRPDKEAVVRQGPDGRRETVTHGELDDRVNRVANALSAAGYEQGDTIAVFMQNNVETIEIYLAAMKLGVIPVPVNHRFEAEEVRYVLEDSGSELLVFDADAAVIVDEIHGLASTPDSYRYVGADTPKYADSYETFREEGAAERVEVVPTRLDVAMLMYTSGTTGDPKGCLLTHDNLLQRVTNGIVDSAMEGEDANPDGRSLVVTPLFHIAAFGLFLSNYYITATTVLLDDFEPVRVMEVLEEEEITRGSFVPMMARALLNVPNFDDYDLSALETFGIGAAPAGRELKQTIVDRFGGDLTEAFGQTEMSPTTTRLHPDDVLEKSDSVGRPILNLMLKVVDPQTGEEVGPGEIGQVCYKGPTRFQGYDNMPEKTAEVIDEDGWFHSGDLVRQDEDGFVYFAGRSDDMIISGGENIYPAEIEEVLHEHEAIDEAAVVGVPDETWGERVKAAVVLHDGYDLTAEAVQDSVGSRLADFKKPREVLFLDALPRNPTGKVLKADLEEPAGEVLESSA
jgi:acyl-CoA synthetase (AMP-forming)/AMP-acid ligase II